MKGTAEEKGMVCAACGSRDKRLLAPLRLDASGSGKTAASLAQCKSCGLKYVDYRPSQNSIEELYGNGKYYEEVGTDGFNADGTLKFPTHKLKLYRRVLDRLESYLNPGKIRVLDIGCGWGHFLKAASERGWEAHGVEPSTPCAEYVKEKLGIDVYNGFPEEAAFEAGSFDAVYMGDVLEHLPEPFDTLLEAKRILRPGGVIVIKTPNADCALDKLDVLYLKVIFYARPKKNFFLHHLYRFTHSALRKGVEKRGFECLETMFFQDPFRTKARGILRDIAVNTLAASGILPAQRTSLVLFARKEG